MKDNGTVRGEKEQAVRVLIGTDTVYVRSNIRDYDKLDSQGNVVGVGAEYEEVQYDKDEYLRLLVGQEEARN